MLNGAVYFDFGADSERLHTLVERAMGERVPVTVIWRPLAAEPAIEAADLDAETKLLAAHELIRDQASQRRFRQAVFTMVYRHGDPLDDPVTLRAAIKVAGMDWSVVENGITRDGPRLLGEVRSAATAAGVADLPAYVGGGPPVTIRLSQAATMGSARDKLDVIARMARNDGVWALYKPE